MIPREDDPVDADEPAGVITRAPAHAGDQEVAAHEAAKLGARLLRHFRKVGPGDDRREDAVDVEQDRAPLRRVAERSEDLDVHAAYDSSVPRASLARSLPQLVGIGVVGGFFSALFGVGGGIVVVPFLVLVLGLDSKVATGTSLAVIGVTALFGVAAFWALEEVRWDDAAIVGLPAMAGTLAGIHLQQRISSRALVLVFAAFLLAVAVRLFLE